MKLKRVVMLIVLVLAIIGTTSYGTGIDFSPIETQEPEIEIPTLEKPEPDIDVPTHIEKTNTQSSTSHGGGYNRGDQQSSSSGDGPGTSSSIDFDYQNYQPAEQQGYDKVTNWAGSFLGILRNIGVIVGVVGIAIIGIKYMIGSVEQKAQYKQTLIPFAIGILMLVAGTVLVSVIYEIFA